MISIKSKINDVNTFFNILKNEIGGSLTSDSKEYNFDLDESIGNGSIRYINLDEGISVLELNLDVYEDINLCIDTLLGTHVNFIYCSDGKLSHSFDACKTINTIETFQTSILSNISNASNTIILEKGVPTVATIISVNTSSDATNTSHWTNSLRKTFIDGKTHDFLYIGSYNLKIIESIKQLQAITQKGLVRALLIKGIVNVILALELEQHQYDVEHADMQPTSLTKTDLIAIEDLSEYINNYPDLEHRIDKLTRKVGLSAAKIQEGFKLKHGFTVCEYIRFVRLSKSEELIANTDLNISEIVYSLGFSSRSYFSKIFKERFNCTPMDYKKNKLAVSA